MRRRWVGFGFLLFAFFVGGFFGACSNDVTTPRLNETFVFHVEVVDSAGDVVPNLRVHVWNHMTAPFYVSQRMAPKEAIYPATTTIPIAVPKASRASLTIFDLGNRPVATLLDDEVLLPGVFHIQWPVPDGLPNGVYKCHFVAADTLSGLLAFEDSTYAVLADQVPSPSNLLGWTDTNGVVESRDPLRFPSVLELPPLLHISADGQELGSFEILDGLTITLVDTSQNMIRFERIDTTVRRGMNWYRLIWGPTIESDRDAGSSFPKDAGPITIRVARPEAAIEWNLGPNYPNPFW